MKIRIVNRSKHKLPEYLTEKSAEWISIEKPENTNRGNGDFGHTGKK